MSRVLDVSADVPRLDTLRPVGGLTPEEGAPLAEELAAYAQHFAPLFYRREQRECAEVYLRGLLTADIARKNVEAMGPCDGTGVDGLDRALSIAMGGA